MTEILEFIDYINSYLDDDYKEYVDYVGGKRYFTNGGCYEFAKILSHFIPTAKLYQSKAGSSKYKRHIIVKIDGFYYDANGLVNQIVAENEFVEIPIKEQEQLTDFIGIREISINGIKIDQFIIKETEMIIEERKGKGIDKLISTINEKILLSSKEEAKLKLVLKD